MGRGAKWASGAALLVLAPGAAGLGAPSHAGIADAAPGPEQAILDAFFAQYDRVPGLPYCARIGGGERLQDMPPLAAGHFNATNALFDEHTQWHSRYASLRGQSDAPGDGNTYGDAFVFMHRHMVQMYDAWRAAEGLEPVPLWDPATPIPPEFAYAIPDACQPRHLEIPPIPLPGWLTREGGDEPSHFFGYTRLCEFPDLNRLGKETDFQSMQPVVVVEPAAAFDQRVIPEAYHSQVHAGVGGDMDRPWWSVRDPVFWGWHKYLDTHFQLWERACAGREPIVPTAEMAGMRWLADEHHAPAPASEPAPAPEGRATPPLPGALGLLALASAAVAWRSACRRR